MNKKDRFLKRLGHRMAEAREREGLTQSQLGEMVGTSQQIVANYETGTRHIPAWRLVRVAEAHGDDRHDRHHQL